MNGCIQSCEKWTCFIDCIPVMNVTVAVDVMNICRGRTTLKWMPAGTERVIAFVDDLRVCCRFIPHNLMNENKPMHPGIGYIDWLEKCSSEIAFDHSSLMHQPRHEWSQYRSGNLCVTAKSTCGLSNGDRHTKQLTSVMDSLSAAFSFAVRGQPKTSPCATQTNSAAPKYPAAPFDTTHSPRSPEPEGENVFSTSSEATI